MWALSPVELTLEVPTVFYSLIQIKLICQIKQKLPAFAGYLLFQIPLFLTIVNRIKRVRKLLNVKVWDFKFS